MLLYEAKLLKHLEGGQGVANLYYSGSEGWWAGLAIICMRSSPFFPTGGFNIMVMDLLGPSLEENILRFNVQTTTKGTKSAKKVDDNIDLNRDCFFGGSLQWLPAEIFGQDDHDACRADDQQAGIPPFQGAADETPVTYTTQTEILQFYLVLSCRVRPQHEPQKSKKEQTSGCNDMIVIGLQNYRISISNISW